MNKSFLRPTFRKEERLKSKKLIDELMQKGASYQEYPFKFIYLGRAAQGPSPVQVCIAVPKRRINKANQRNLIKRRMREAWRTNKHFIYGFLQQHGTEVSLMIIYTGKEDMPFSEIKAKMEKAVQKFPQQYESHQPPA